jgi:Effector-associated domain 1
MSILDESPFPFSEPDGEKLQRVMAGIYRTYDEATTFAEPFNVNALEIPENLAAMAIWRELLERLARSGKVRAAVEATRNKFPGNANVPFLDALLTEKPSRIAVVLKSRPFGWLRASGQFLAAQAKFFAGLAACLILIGAFFMLIPDDEIAIKTVDERGGRVSFVNLQYEPRKSSPSGQPKTLQAPDDEGFFRIQQHELAEPPQIGLILDEANLPPRWTGNHALPVLQVVKVNYAEYGVPLWNKTRKLFLYVKLEGGNARGDQP